MHFPKSESHEKKIKEEIKHMKDLKHKNIIQYIDSYVFLQHHDENVIGCNIIMELADGIL